MKTMHHPGTEFSLYVGDLPLDCSDEKLQGLFRSKFRSVKRVQIIRNEDGSSRGFGFIRFESRDDFEAALSQEMKVGNATLRLDTAHTKNNKNRNRYNSFNSSVGGSNHHGSNHHNHHHHHHHFNNNHHHHQQQQQHQHHNHQPQQQHHQSQQQPPQQQHNNNQLHQNKVGKTTPSDSGPSVGGHQQHQHQLPNSSLTHQRAISSQTAGGSVLVSGGGGGLQQSAAAGVSNLHPTGQQHNSSHNLYTPKTQNHNQSQQQQHNSNQLKVTPETNDKQSLLKPASQSASPDDGSQQSQPLSQASTLSQSQLTPSSVSQTSGQPNIQQQANNITSTATTTTPSNAMTSVNHPSVLPSNNNLNINPQQPAITPDLRGYPAAPMMDTHLLSTTDQPSMMPPNSVYGHLYPYGPPTFGYMPPPQPNPVIPISAVPPAPPNQASPSTGAAHSHGHSMSASTTQRYNSAQHHQPHPHHHHHHQQHQHQQQQQQQQHHHHQQHQQQPQQPHTGQNADGVMNTMPGAPHQGQSFYYYYPSPLYFDQAGGAAGPPSLYHTQPFHPQFFAMPNPAYLPNAHAFNQHHQQPPTASQSDAPPPVINQQQPHQPQVNMRTRDIDTKIE